MSHLDEAAIQTLSLMTRVAESVSSEHHAPTLYWVLRDFALQLVDVDGKAISHGEYLEQALRTGGKANATREAIKSVFPKRHLVTCLDRKGDSAQRLDQKGTSALAPNPAVSQHLSIFMYALVDHRAPGRDMTGEVHAAYVRDLRIVSQEIVPFPILEDSWSLLSQGCTARKRQNAHFVKKCSVAEASSPHLEPEVIIRVMNAVVLCLMQRLLS